MHRITLLSFRFHFTLSRKVDITVEFSCSHFLGYSSMYFPLKSFIELIFFHHFGCWITYSTFQFLFGSSTRVIRYTHCWDVNFVFNLNFGLVLSTIHLAESRRVQAIVCFIQVCELRSAEHLIKSVPEICQCAISHYVCLSTWCNWYKVFWKLFLPSIRLDNGLVQSCPVDSFGSRCNFLDQSTGVALCIPFQ